MNNGEQHKLYLVPTIFCYHFDFVFEPLHILILANNCTKFRCKISLASLLFFLKKTYCICGFRQISGNNSFQFWNSCISITFQLGIQNNKIASNITIHNNELTLWIFSCPSEECLNQFILSNHGLIIVVYTFKVTLAFLFTTKKS